VKLKDKTDVFAAGGGALDVIGVGHELVADPDGAVVRPVEQAKEIRVVLLPQPEGPTMAVTWPRRASKETPRSTCTLPPPGRDSGGDSRTGARCPKRTWSGAHCDVPRMMSPGSRRAARRAGMMAAVITTTAAVRVPIT